MAKGSSSNRWLRRQSADRYVKQRELDGYRSRAAYKLSELNTRERLIRAQSRVLDLGAAPGGWTQVAAKIVGRGGTVVAVDVLKMKALAGATLIQGDCRDDSVLTQVTEALGKKPVDLVMSDMAPNISGIAAQDEAAVTELALLALDLGKVFLRPGGALLVKLFQSAETDGVVGEIGRHFASVTRRKPAASRTQSRELYVVAKQFGI